jgi:hypothetical protein
MRKILLSIVAIFFILSGALFAPLEVFGQATVSKTAPTKTASEKPAATEKSLVPQTSVAIPVPEIAAKATEVTILIRDIQAKLSLSTLTESIGLLLPRKAEQISRQLSETKKILQNEPTLSVLQGQQQLWQQVQGDTNIWLQVLTKRATLIRENLNQLVALEATWSVTLGEALKDKVPQPILQQIKEVIASISTEKGSLEVQRTAVLDLQSKVAQGLTQCNAILGMVSQAQQKAMGGIFTRDGIPIWNPYIWTYLVGNFPVRVGEVTPEWWKQISSYLREPALGLPLHMGLFIAHLAVFWTVRRRIHQWKVGGEEISSRLMVFEMPCAAALFLSLSIGSGPHTNVPLIVKGLFEILIFAPIIRLIRPVVDRRVLPALYTLWILFAIDVIRQEISGGQYSGQFILILETLAGVIILLRSLYADIFIFLRYRAAGRYGCLSSKSVQFLRSLLSQQGLLQGYWDI